MKWLIPTLIVVIGGVVAFNCKFFFPGKSQRGSMVERWETANDAFKIRVTAYKEKGVLLAGTYYVFESAQLGSGEWREFMTFRHDDRPYIPREQVRFIDDQVGYAFMGWMYAITTNGGIDWSIWNANQDLLNEQGVRYRIIENVQVEPSGTGKMTLNPIPQGKVKEIYTKDYGKHWSVE